MSPVRRLRPLPPGGGSRHRSRAALELRSAIHNENEGGGAKKIRCRRSHQTGGAADGNQTHFSRRGPPRITDDAVKDHRRHVTPIRNPSPRARAAVRRVGSTMTSCRVSPFEDAAASAAALIQDRKRRRRRSRHLHERFSGRAWPGSALRLQGRSQHRQFAARDLRWRSSQPSFACRVEYPFHRLQRHASPSRGASVVVAASRGNCDLL